MQKALAKDFIDVKIDIDRMTNGKALAKRLRKSERGGVPWMVVLDASGKALITGDGPRGNIGCPIQPEERAHFIKMLRETRQRMTEEDIATVKASLDAYAEKILEARRKARSPSS